MANWEPTPVDIKDNDFSTYEAGSDWISFDCLCMDKEQPNYENLPYDFNIKTLEAQTFTCPRCGRIYRMATKIDFEVYTPLAIKYPNTNDRMPSETLGLRDKE